MLDGAIPNGDDVAAAMAAAVEIHGPEAFQHEVPVPAGLVAPPPPQQGL